MESELQDAMNTIRKIYKKEAKGKTGYPTMKPATDAEIKAFEKKMGKTLPEDFTEYLKSNDIPMAFNFGCFALSFAQIVEEWDLLKRQLDAGLFDDKLKALKKNDQGNWNGGYIKKAWWHDKWIPFAKDDEGNLKCIDLDPAKGGDRGQVLTLNIPDDLGPFASDFASFTAYLEEQAYQYSEKEYTVETAEDGSLHISLDTAANEIRKKIDLIRKVYVSESTGDVKYNSLTKAGSEAIKAFEKKLGISLPYDYVNFLKNNDIEMAFDGGFEAMPLDRVIRVWEMMKEHLDNGVFDDGRIEHHEKEDFGNWKGDYVKKVWWSTKWIPFAEDSCGNMKCIDLDPGINGEKGQITAMEVQDGQGPFATNYLSFSAYLEEQAELYENKKYEVEEGWNGSPLISLDSYR